METAAVSRREPGENMMPAGALTLQRRADGRLWAVRGGVERAVWVRRCFPWSEPARFVSLRDDEEREVALVRDPAELDPASRRVLEEATVAAGFVFEIIRVTAIEEEGEIRHWRGGSPAGGGRPPDRPPPPPRAPPPRRRPRPARGGGPG